LLRHLGADGCFTLLCFRRRPARVPPGITPVLVSEEERPDALWDHSGLAGRRFGARAGEALLLRPDQHLCARFLDPGPAELAAAHAHALGRT
jgi:3-(3-hydroxy-phenyl)propionate hydroxylase